MTLLKRFFIYTVIVLFVTLTSGYTQSKNTIAVLPLSGTGISEPEMKVLSEEVRSVLVRTNKYTVLERSNMEAILNEQGFQLSGCVSTECAVEAGKLLGVQKMLTGSIGKIGNLYNINLRIFNVSTSEIEKSFSGRHDGAVEGLLDVLSAAVFQLTEAQDKDNEGGVFSKTVTHRKFSILAGMTSMKTTLHEGPQTGFTVGGAYHFFFNDLSLSPELLFVSKGYEYFNSSEIISFENLQLALICAYHLKPVQGSDFIMTFEGGPSANLILKGTKEDETDTYDLFNYDNGSVIRQTEFSIVLGTSFGFNLEKMLVALKIRYELGLTDLFNNEEQWEAGKSRVLFVMLEVGL